MVCGSCQALSLFSKWASRLEAAAQWHAHPVVAVVKAQDHLLEEPPGLRDRCTARRHPYATVALECSFAAFRAIASADDFGLEQATDGLLLRNTQL